MTDVLDCRVISRRRLRSQLPRLPARPGAELRGGDGSAHDAVARAERFRKKMMGFRAEYETR